MGSKSFIKIFAIFSILLLTSLVSNQVIADHSNPPIAVDDSVSTDSSLTTDEDTAFTIGINVLTSNDSGVGHPISFESLNILPMSGTITSSSTTLTYDPNGKFEFLRTSSDTAAANFSYVISTSSGTDSADVTIEITGVNDAPTANDDSGEGFTTDENTPFTTGNVITTSGTDTDPDQGDMLSIVIFGPDTDVATGSASNNNDGTYFYDPNGQFEYLDDTQSDTDGFFYTIKDKAESSDSAGVTITITGVNDPPIANDDTNTTADEDTVLNVPDGSGDVEFNDTDVDANDTVLTVDPAISEAGDGSGVGNGAFAIIADGSYSFDPSGQFEYLGTGESETSFVDYEIYDGTARDTGRLTVTVNGVNDAPIAVDDTNTTADEDTVLNVPDGLGDVQFNDTDVDTSDTLTVDPAISEAGDGSGVGNGAFAIIADGSYSFDPSDQFEYLDDGESETSFVDYEIYDGTVRDEGRLTVTVNGVNDAPVANDDANSTFENTVLIIPNSASDVESNDTDVDANDTVLTVDPEISEAPGNGSGVGDGLFTINADGSYEFDDNGEFEYLGTGEFETTYIDYEISDGTAKDTGRLTITVNGVNDAPVITVNGGTATHEAGPVYDLAADDLAGGGTRASAFDAEEGDLTSQIVTDLSNVDFENPGAYIVTYSLTDSDLPNGTTPLPAVVKTRDVTVEDTTSPIFTTVATDDRKEGAGDLITPIEFTFTVTADDPLRSTNPKINCLDEDLADVVVNADGTAVDVTFSTVPGINTITCVANDDVPNVNLTPYTFDLIVSEIFFDTLSLNEPLWDEQTDTSGTVIGFLESDTIKVKYGIDTTHEFTHTFGGTFEAATDTQTPWDSNHSFTSPRSSTIQTIEVTLFSDDTEAQTSSKTALILPHPTEIQAVTTSENTPNTKILWGDLITTSMTLVDTYAETPAALETRIDLSGNGMTNLDQFKDIVGGVTSFEGNTPVLVSEFTMITSFSGNDQYEPALDVANIFDNLKHPTDITTNNIEDVLWEYDITKSGTLVDTHTGEGTIIMEGAELEISGDGQGQLPIFVFTDETGAFTTGPAPSISGVESGVHVITTYLGDDLYEAAVDDDDTYSTTPHESSLDLFPIPTVDAGSIVTVAGQLFDEDLQELIADKTITFPETVTPLDEAISAATSAAAFRIEGTFNIDGSEILRLEEGDLMTFPSNPEVVVFRLGDMGNRQIKLTVIAQDGSDFKVTGKGKGANIGILTISHPSGISTVEVTTITGVGGSGILDIEFLNGHLDRTYLIEFVDFVGHSGTSDGPLLLKDVNFDSTGRALLNEGQSYDVTAFFSDPDYLPDSDTESFITTSSAGSTFLDIVDDVIPDSGVGITSEVCAPGDDEERGGFGDALCDSWEGAGNGVPYTVNGEALLYELVGTTPGSDPTPNVDLLVEIDAHNLHSPDPQTLSDVFDTFDAQGINLIQTVNDDTITHIDEIAVWTDEDLDNTNDFAALKSLYFGTVDERPTIERGILLEPDTFLTQDLLLEFDDDMLDSTGNGNFATTADSELYLKGIDGNAFDFNGSTKLDLTALSASDLDFDINDPFSISYWVNPDTTGTQHILDKRDSTHGGYVFFLDSGNEPALLTSADSGNKLYVRADTGLSTDVWQYVVITKDSSGTAAGVKIYVDGVEVSTTPVFDTLTSGDTLNTAIPTLGTRFNSVNFLDGQLDDLALYEIVLTSGQVAELFIPAVIEIIGPAESNISSNALYNFNDDVLDSSGNGNDGTTPVAGAETYVTREDGKAFDFDGVTHISLDSSASILDFDRTDSYSIAYWINTDGSGKNQHVIDKRDATHGGWVVYLDKNEKPGFLTSFDRNNKISLIADTAVPIGVWTHVAITYDGTTSPGTVVMYIDGSPVGTTGTTNLTSGDTLNTAIPVIGERFNDKEGVFGAVDDLGVYAFTLTPSQVLELINPDTDPLVVSYNFDLDVLDDSGNGNDGIITGEPFPYVPGQFEFAFDFDGVTHIDLLTSASDLDFDRNDPFSISYWVNPDTTGTQHILDKRDTTHGGYVFFLDSGNEPALLTSADSGNKLYVRADTGLLTGVWQHVAITKDDSGTSAGVKIYVDGVPVSTTPVFDTLTSGDTLNAGIPTVGTRYNLSGFVDGQLDNLALYEVVLSQDAIDVLSKPDLNKLRSTVTISDIFLTTPPNPDTLLSPDSTEGEINIKVVLTTVESTIINEDTSTPVTIENANGDFTFGTPEVSTSSTDSDVVKTLRVSIPYSTTQVVTAGDIGDITIPITSGKAITAVDFTSHGLTASTTQLDAKAQAYRYIFFTHGIGGSSGQAELRGNDAIIALGGTGFTEVDGHVIGNVAEQSGTYLHEFGHLLNLNHGGPVYLLSDPDTTLPATIENCVPTHNSVMSYVGQLPTYKGINWNLDFSDVSGVTLDEDDLTASPGVDLPGAPDIFWSTPEFSGLQLYLSGAADNSPLDWNGDGNVNISDTNTSHDLNNFDIFGCQESLGSEFEEFSEWDNLDFNFRQGPTGQFDGCIGDCFYNNAAIEQNDEGIGSAKIANAIHEILPPFLVDGTGVVNQGSNANLDIIFGDNTADGSFSALSGATIDAFLFADYTVNGNQGVPPPEGEHLGTLVYNPTLELYELDWKLADKQTKGKYGILYVVTPPEPASPFSLFDESLLFPHQIQPENGGDILEMSVAFVVSHSKGKSDNQDSSPPVIVPPNITNPFELTLPPDLYDETLCTVSDNDPVYDEDCIITGGINTSVLGLQTATYNAPDDPAGNTPTTIVVESLIQDTILPIITLNGVDPVLLVPDVDPSYVDPGAVISDNSPINGDTIFAPDVPAILLDGIDPEDTGTYLITYSANDLSTGLVQVQRTIIVGDTMKPVIIPFGVNDPTTPEGQFQRTSTDLYPDTCIATDDDDDYSEFCFVLSRDPVGVGIDTTVPGYQSVTFDADCDPSGNCPDTVFVDITIVDTLPPTITLNGNEPINLMIGDPAPSDPGAIISDNSPINGLAAASSGIPLDLQDGVHAEDVGPYFITYSADDGVNPVVEITRTINVGGDTTKPVIAPLAINDPTTPVGQFQRTSIDIYFDSCTATDDDIGYSEVCFVLSRDPVGVGIDTTVPGYQSVTYDADCDPSGNCPDTVFVDITVVDTLPPTILLNGDNPLNLLVGDTYVDPGAVISDNSPIDGTFASVSIPAELIGVLTSGDVGSHTVTYSADDGVNPIVEVTRTVNVGAASDVLTITNVEYNERNTQFRVSLTSTVPDASIVIYESNGTTTFGLLGSGVMKNNGGGDYSFRDKIPTLPTHMTIMSDNGGIIEHFPIP